MKNYLMLMVVLLLAGCATTPFDNETAAGVRINITLGDSANVNDITITTSSDNTQENETSAEQDATQDTAVDVDPSSVVNPAGSAAGGVIKKITGDGE